MKTALLASLAALMLSLSAACGGELSEDDVLKKLAPSMVTIQFRGRDIGSGFLVEGNYIVTAAHVVWGLPGIDVVFHDGTEHEDVPIAAYDYFTDLAFLGPIDTSAPALKFAEIDALTTEDKAFIIGDPRGPGGISVSEGNFYTTMDWPEADATIIYASAEVKLGMSGGPITNESGEVIGVLVRKRGEDLGWGPSSDTIRDRLNKVSRVEDITVLGNRPLPDIGEGSREHQFVLRDRWDAVTLVSEVSRHSVEFDSYRDVEYGFFDINGNGVFTPDFRTVQKGLTERCCITGPGFIEVRQRFDIERHVAIRVELPWCGATTQTTKGSCRLGILSWEPSILLVISTGILSTSRGVKASLYTWPASKYTGDDRSCGGATVRYCFRKSVFRRDQVPCAGRCHVHRCPADESWGIFSSSRLHPYPPKVMGPPKRLDSSACTTARSARYSAITSITPPPQSKSTTPRTSRAGAEK